MATPKTPAQLAKQAAFADIAEDLKEECKRRKMTIADEFAPRNCIIREREICDSLGIPQPDFRVFNGGARVRKKK